LSINQFKKLLFFLVIGGFTCWIVSWFFLNLELHELIEHVPFNQELRIFLTERLVKIDTPPYTPCESSKELERVIYVMGGSQKSLKNRFKTAAELYQRGIGKKILVFSEPGITEYDPQIGRNLTNDEWAIRRLIEFGVEEKDIEFVSVKRRGFGTLSEAKAVSSIVSKRNIKYLMVVSSSYHTMRTWITFSKFISNENINLKIYASNDPINLCKQLLEYLKLISYKYIILPIY